MTLINNIIYKIMNLINVVVFEEIKINKFNYKKWPVFV